MVSSKSKTKTIRQMKFEKMKNWLIAFAILGGGWMSAEAQQEPIALQVNGEYVTLSDFEAIFMKNNRDSTVARAALDEYMDLFVNFKLKVTEAEALGMDTSAAFRRELEGYRAQLARPYLTDSDLLDDLVIQAFERQQEEVRARHILVNCSETASPADTLIAWNRARQLRKRVLSGEDFEAVATGKGGSDDPSVRDNGGDLGWFTAFSMVYPFEEAAYNTPVNGLSEVVRTRFGYHFLEVTGRRDARGEVKVAHIMVRTRDPKDSIGVAEAEDRIRTIHNELVAGAPWQEMAMKYSDDKSSSGKGGELPWFGTGKMVESFEDASFALTEDGQISAPFRTSFGWHIVKRIARKPLPTFEASKREIEKKVSRDSRADLTRQSFLAKLKAEYGFKAYPKALAPFRKLASATDSAFFENHPVTGLGDKARRAVLIELAGATATVGDFVDDMNSRRFRNAAMGPEVLIDEAFASWSDKLVLDHEDAQLETKYDAFRLLMEEYHDGILLFELTDEQVWSRAVEDTIGLETFHREHATDFMWDRRADVRIFTCGNKKIAKKVRKLVAGEGDLVGYRRDVVAEDALALSIESGKYEAGENPWGDKVLEAATAGEIKTKPGTPSFLEFTAGGDEIILIEVREIRPAEPKSLEEARGQVIAAYQDHLEKSWIERLKAKYEVVVYPEVIYTLAGD